MIHVALLEEQPFLPTLHGYTSTLSQTVVTGCIKVGFITRSYKPNSNSNLIDTYTTRNIANM